MRLYGSAFSPFVRKTRIVVGELALDETVDFVSAEGTPLDDPGLRAKNPLKKIPFLEFSDGRLAYDSRVVCVALIEAATDEAAKRALLPSGGPDQMDALTRQALADGMCDAAVSVAYERRLRPAEFQWDVWMDMQLDKVAAALDALENTPPPSGRFDLGDCAVAATLPYLDLRFPDRPWRDGRPALTAWWAEAQRRPSVAATLPES